MLELGRQRQPAMALALRVSCVPRSWGSEAKGRNQVNGHIMCFRLESSKRAGKCSWSSACTHRARLRTNPFMVLLGEGCFFAFFLCSLKSRAHADQQRSYKQLSDRAPHSSWLSQGGRHVPITVWVAPWPSHGKTQFVPHEKKTNTQLNPELSLSFGS